MKIRHKLFLWYTGVFIVSASAVMAGFYAFTAHKFRSDYERYLLEEYSEIEYVLKRHDGDIERFASDVSAVATDQRAFTLVVRIVDPSRKLDRAIVPDDYWRTVIQKANVPEPRGNHPGFTKVAVSTSGRELLIATGQPLPERFPDLRLQVGLYNKPLVKHLELLREYFGMALFSCILLAAAGGWFLAGRSLRPVDKLVADLAHVESGVHGDRLPVGDSRDEIEGIRRAVNSMLERIDAAIDQIRAFTGDAAHELRTPVSKLRCRIEVALKSERSAEEYRDTLEDSLAQCAHLTRLVNSLLVLARLDEAAEIKREPVNLGDVIADVVELFTISAEEKNIALRAPDAAGCRVTGDAALLRQLIANVLDNAIKFTPEGGEVRLTSECAPDACILRVSDTGPGIPEEVRERIFDRFYQATKGDPKERTGAGLGLSICRKIAELHDGRIELEASGEGGTTLVIVLPTVGSA